MLDIEIRQFKDDLIALINEQQLPIEVKRLVVLEVYNAVTKASDDFITQQKQSIVEQLKTDDEQKESNEVTE